MSRRQVRRAHRQGRPHRLTVGAVERAMLLLPAGDLRRRYERELIAELYGLSAHRQATFAATTLLTAWSLRRALTRTPTGGTMTINRPRKPLGCILNVRHQYVVQSTEDGGRYRRCTRCGKDKYDGPAVSGIGIAGVGPSGG